MIQERNKEEEGETKTSREYKREIKSITNIKANRNTDIQEERRKERERQ
jgi:hypothetical protein